MSDILFEHRGHTGYISLNRPRALNALNLPMIRALSAQLLAWKSDPGIRQVAIRGMSKPTAEGVQQPFGNFSAGGDIRFFHQAVQTGNPELEDFFTEEYALNHLIGNYPKAYIAFMDGLVFGGGMGISQGASHRLVTERSKLAMPETGIGLFPDVGGGYFLSRCPGFMGEYLALTGVSIGAAEALAYGLADQLVASSEMPGLWEALETHPIDALNTFGNAAAPEAKLSDGHTPDRVLIDPIFGLPTVPAMLRALDLQHDTWSQKTAAVLRSRSPLMLHVVLEQIRRGRHMSLAENLCMERGMVRHCFYTAHMGRWGNASETVEGIRALAVDKDHKPNWFPIDIGDVTPDMVEPFFVSPWPPASHPLAHLLQHTPGRKAA